MAYSTGIDLGTTNTVVSTARRGVNGTVEVLTEKLMQFSEDGYSLEPDELLPSVLYIEDGEHFVGKRAKAMKGQCINKVISNSKNFIGQSDYKWEVDGRSYSPEIVASYYLSAVRQNLQDKYTYECDLNNVVITVPASFDLDQRNATKKAAKLAGFGGNIICISEPTAAILDFINEQRRLADEDRYLDFSEMKRVLVFDLGGGTCDVAVLAVKMQGKEVYVEELGVSPHTLLGGTHFDAYAAEGIIRDFEKENNIDLASIVGKMAQKELKAKLLIQMEKAKIFFAGRYAMKQDESIIFPVHIPSIINGEPFRFKLTMKQYNNYIKPLLQQDKNQENIISPIDDTLKNIGKAKEEIDYVFCVGGMTQYPAVASTITNYFGKKPFKFCDSMQSVSKGAAIYQHYDVKERQHQDIDIDIVPTLPQTVFLNVKDDFPIALIEAKTKAGEPRIHRDLLEVTSEVQAVLQLYTGSSYFDPHMKLLDDVILKFPHGIPVGSKLSLKLEYTQQGVLAFEAWVEEHPEIKVNVCLENGEITESTLNKVREDYEIEKVGGLYNARF